MLLKVDSYMRSAPSVEQKAFKALNSLVGILYRLTQSTALILIFFFFANKIKILSMIRGTDQIPRIKI